MNAVRLPNRLAEIELCEFFDDFMHTLDSTNKFAVTATDSGTATVGTTVGGVVPLLPSDGSVADNDEIYLASKLATFKPLAGQPIYFETLLQFAEANTSAANVFAGLMSAVAGNALIDDGGGPRASGAVIGIYKVDGGTVWRCVSRNGSTVTDTVSTFTAGGTNYQYLRVEVIDVTSTQATAAFRVNGQILRDTNNNWIVHTLPLAAIAACQPCVLVKNGSANQETVNVDYLGCWQTRAFPPAGV